MLFKTAVASTLTSPRAEVLFGEAVREVIRGRSKQPIVAKIRCGILRLRNDRQVTSHVDDGQQNDAQVSGYCTENFHGRKVAEKMDVWLEISPSGGQFVCSS